MIIQLDIPNKLNKRLKIVAIYKKIPRNKYIIDLLDKHCHVEFKE
jgi:hypothetical protein